MIILVLIICLQLYFASAQQSTPVEERRCNAFKQQVYETNIPFIPLLAGDADEINVKVDKCKAKYIPLVLGGVDAEPREFPDMARIGRRPESSETTTWFCGGTLITERFVLTAAHCFYSEHGVVNRVRLGELDFDRTTDDARPEEFVVRKNTPHPDYDWKETSTYNDIGLIELDRAVRFNEYIHPACLPQTNGDEQTNLVAVGWGRTGIVSAAASHLQKVGLQRFASADCDRFTRDAGVLTAGLNATSQICAGSSMRRDTCDGDSGGPLFTYHTNYPCMHILVGITSLGVSGCATPGIPAIYTRVYPFNDWINRSVFR